MPRFERMTFEELMQFAADPRGATAAEVGAAREALRRLGDQRSDASDKLLWFEHLYAQDERATCELASRSGSRLHREHWPAAAAASRLADSILASMEFALPLYAVQRLANGTWLVRTQMGDPLWPAVDVVAVLDVAVLDEEASAAPGAP
jgi:hypothetical protein